jgi:hypothetical protein
LCTPAGAGGGKLQLRIYKLHDEIMGEAKEARQQVRKCAIKTNDPLGSERFD